MTIDYECDYTNLDTSSECLKLKTYGDLRESYEKYSSFGENKKHANECHSTVNLPLFNDEDNVYIIEKCIVPELHILQGFVNTMFWNGIVPLLGRENAFVWPKKLKLIARNYHGNIFEGNACRKLLKEADKLLDPEVMSECTLFEIMPFISTFKAMNKIVENCFSIKRVAENLESNIGELNKCFKATGVSETLKIHIILHHLSHCLYFLKNDDGLGLWSEQAGESILKEFLIFWERFKINIIEDENYGNQLKRAVVEFSSQHI